MRGKDSAARRCPDCRMHRTLCICALITGIATRTRLVLILHQHEHFKPTNTGRLAAQCLTNSVVTLRGIGAVADPSSLWAVPGTVPLLLLPAADARPLEEWRASPEPVVLVVPDGTWSQARRARRRIAGLDKLPCVALPDRGKSSYRLRHTGPPDRLGTMEAIAMAMGILEGPEVEQQLQYIFRVMVDRTLWTNGRIATSEVTGGIPEGVQSHDPMGRAT